LLLLLLLPLFQLPYLEHNIILLTCTSRTDTNGKFARIAEEHITVELVRMAMHHQKRREDPIVRKGIFRHIGKVVWRIQD
jgi:hypothetical protein